MTKKRFIGSSGGVYDQYKGDRFTWAEWEEIIQIMNNLNEKSRERSKALSKLQKKNEQLKKQLESKEKAHTRCDELYQKLYEKNEQLKQDNTTLIRILENQSIIIQKLHSKILEFRLKEPIVLTKEDLELMGKAISYYTHGRCPE